VKKFTDNLEAKMRPSESGHPYSASIVLNVLTYKEILNLLLKSNLIVDPWEGADGEGADGEGAAGEGADGEDILVPNPLFLPVTSPNRTSVYPPERNVSTSPISTNMVIDTNVYAAMPVVPIDRVQTKGTAATRELIVRLRAMVLGWERSWTAEEDNMICSLARKCFAEASAMSPLLAKQGPGGWLSIIDQRCPLATQFDTLIVHYLNATRRASGNRPGYDKDFRRHASAYRQQLCFFKSIKIRPPIETSKLGCRCTEDKRICIYPGNASSLPTSPACTTPTLGW
jgi:hypothetical protein